MKQLKLILTVAIIAIGQIFAIPASAAKCKVGKSGGFNFLPSFCAVCFAVIISGATFINSHSGLLSAIFAGNTAWAQGIGISVEGCKVLRNGKWVSCSPSSAVKPNAEGQELENPRAQIEKAEEVRREANDAISRAAEAERAAQAANFRAANAKRTADAAKGAVNAARGRLGAAQAAVKAARRSDAACKAAAGKSAAAHARCSQSRHSAVQAANKVVREAKKAVKKAKNAANKAVIEAKKAAKEAKKLERAAKKVAQVERDYAACVIATNGDSTALVACKKSRDSKIKAAK